MFEPQEVKELVSQALQSSCDFFRQDKLQDSALLTQQILKIDPSNVPALQLLGLIEYRQKNYEKALEFFQQALEIDSTNNETHNNIAICYSALHNYDKAIEHLNATKKADHVTYGNLASQYRKKRDFDSAIEYFETALGMQNDPHLLVGLGGVYGEANDMPKAIEYFEKAIELDPDFTPAHVDLSYAYHLMGRWEEGWREYEFRHDYYQEFKKWERLYPPEKRWNGCDLNGKKLVVYCEQGWGDIFNFLRFVPKEAVLDVPVPIRGLLEKHGYTIERPEEYGYHCSMMSLPYLLNIDQEDVWKGPYIHTTKKADFGQYTGCKIGIVWAGGPRHPRDRTRSCPLRLFKPLVNLPNTHLFSLQKDLRVRNFPGFGLVDLAEGADFKLIDMSQFLDDWENTAAIVNQMDIIVTVDTAIAHLAGSMGKKVFAMIGYNPDWRWRLSGETTIWYPTVRLFRQENYGDWESVIQSITEALRAEQPR